MMRDSPPELARAFAGPYASERMTFWPRFARCHAVHAPKTPAPITATSYVFCALKVFASYRNPDETKTQLVGNCNPLILCEVFFFSAGKRRRAVFPNAIGD